MYSVMLVDDEQAVLDTLTATIQWESLGIHHIFTASNGAAALEQLKENKVDLLITDIKMPGMDGLTLLSKVRTLYPSIRCILLTAYGEFEYARKALELGVENYLLKPFQQNELEKNIEKTLDNIYINRVNDAKLFRHNILMRWVLGDISMDELSERAPLLDVNIYLRQYCCMIFRKLSDCSLHILGDYLKENHAKGQEFYDVWDNRGQYILISAAVSLEPAILSEQIRTAMKALKMEHTFLCAVGTIALGSENLPTSYRQALELLETANTVSCQDIILLPGFPVDAFKDSLSQRLDVLFHIEDSELRQAGYKQFLEKLSSQSSNPSSLLPVLLHSLYCLFENQFPGCTQAHTQLKQRIHLTFVSSGENMDELLIELLEYSYLLFQYYFEQLSPVIQRAINYIHMHYSSSISIKEFCAKNKMNTSYFGFLFKKETGMFFNNYLTQYRVCCSLRLLEDTQMQVSEISKAVGFSSSNYYISCFKKQTGLSPVKYRSMRI